MRQSMKAKSCIYPQPVLIIGTYDEHGVADAMNAAWGGVADFDKLRNLIIKKIVIASIN